eukprot:MONOS_15601.1-p1 / transcript=MONOS_15601.1 / gene=MONOS_15601 / organism=Monocercomonoides_exilis_PA203 / gene_product=unspecified product / transcript_product=unspecified product / location=Mono_scaffold01284:803-3660(-) / protein_length=488 / sequence_SO=supercontig / SO=protein_coding / is_pseudo=false
MGLWFIWNTTVWTLLWPFMTARDLFEAGSIDGMAHMRVLVGACGAALNEVEKFNGLVLCSHKGFADFYTQVAMGFPCIVSRFAIALFMPGAATLAKAAKTILFFVRSSGGKNDQTEKKITKTKDMGEHYTEQLKINPRLCLFPEGHRMAKRGVLPLRTGTFRIAFERKIRVLIGPSEGSEFVMREKHLWVHKADVELGKRGEGEREEEKKEKEKKEKKEKEKGKEKEKEKAEEEEEESRVSKWSLRVGSGAGKNLTFFNCASMRRSDKALFSPLCKPLLSEEEEEEEGKKGKEGKEGKGKEKREGSQKEIKDKSKSQSKEESTSQEKSISTNKKQKINWKSQQMFSEMVRSGSIPSSLRGVIVVNYRCVVDPRDFGDWEAFYAKCVEEFEKGYEEVCGVYDRLTEGTGARECEWAEEEEEKEEKKEKKEKKEREEKKERGEREERGEKKEKKGEREGREEGKSQKETTKKMRSKGNVSKGKGRKEKEN